MPVQAYHASSSAGFGWRSPGLINGSTPCTPAGREIRQLKEGTVRVDDFLETHYSSVIDLRVATAEKLPAVIVEIVRDVENRFRTFQDLPEGYDRAIPRLIERPVVLVRFFFRTDDTVGRSNSPRIALHRHGGKPIDPLDLRLHVKVDNLPRPFLTDSVPLIDGQGMVGRLQLDRRPEFAVPKVPAIVFKRNVSS